MLYRPRATVFSHSGDSARALSLIEVLVVCAIVLFLIAMLFPSLQTARERIRRVLCANNLNQWGAASRFYQEEFNGYIPTEGPAGGDFSNPGTWYNELPRYLGLPAYKDLEGAGVAIRELPNIHVWICPAKNLTKAFKSESGMNQFHYGMNQVLDGLGSVDHPSPDTPDFPDQENVHLKGRLFAKKPHTVFMFDIAPNSPAGTPRKVATMYYKDFRGERVARFHGDYAHILYFSGAVGACKTDDLVTDRDFRRGDVVWNHPTLYWGYPRR